MTTARRTQEERAETTRDALLTAAVSLVAEGGIEATTLADVAARANVSKGALLHHYESKEALLDAVLDRVSSHIEQAVAAAWDPSAAPFPRLSRALATVLALGNDRPPELRVFLALATAGDHDARVGAAVRLRLGAVERVFAEGVSLTLAELHARSKVAPEVLSRALMAAMLGAALRPGAVAGERADAQRFWEGAILAMIDPFVVDAR